VPEIHGATLTHPWVQDFLEQFTRGR
jgi:hypothetical protein